MLKHYLVIYGGRNNQLCSESLSKSDELQTSNLNAVSHNLKLSSNRRYSTVALNDIWMYDTIKNEWIVIILNAKIPRSRWGASIASIDNRLYLFGGLNLNEYCKPLLYSLTVAEVQLVPTMKAAHGESKKTKDNIEPKVAKFKVL